MHTDVLIVGGGPSGSVAAINLARAGVRTLLLDRAQFPRVKPCAGGLSTRVFTRFPYLKPVFDAVTISYCNRIVFNAPNGEQVEIHDDKPYYGMVRRIEYDAALLNHARQCGAQVREQCDVRDLEYGSDSVTVITSTGERISARLLLGCDGVNSVVALRSGLRQPWRQDQIAIDTTEETSAFRCEPGTIHIYYCLGGGYGYAYVFPKQDFVNLGIGYLASDNRKHARPHPHQQHAELVSWLNERGIIQGASHEAELRSYPIPMAGPITNLTRERTLLAGDAGGFVNGFSAEGIFYAMSSGELAAQVAIEAMRENCFTADMLHIYDERVAQGIGADLRKSVDVGERLFTSPARVNWIVAEAKRNPAAARLFAEYASGRMEYKAFKRALLTTALPFFLRNTAARWWRRLRGTEHAVTPT